MSQPPSLIVTTSHKASDHVKLAAERRAEELSLPFVERDDSPMEVMLRDADAALVFDNAGLHLATEFGRLRFHLGTAFIRLRSLERGDSDPLVRAADFRPGDTVLDTTFGLGRDAMVAAATVGPTGSVLGLEASTALVQLALDGMPAVIDDRWAPIEVRQCDARPELQHLEGSSFDVVLVDPMFTTPKTSDTGFDLLRTVADAAPLDQAWIAEARRVAKRWVVLKSGDAQVWFEDEKLQRVHSHSNATWYRAPARSPR